MLTTPCTMAFRDLSCERNDRQLFNNLSGTIEPGKILRVAGVNGAGKTTLLRILANLYQPDNGTVLINEVVVGECCDQILYFGHKAQISRDLSVAENLYFLTGVDAEKLHLALMNVGLRGFNDSLGIELSQGQGRRSALARLWCDPAPVWILDEPYTALDATMIGALDKRIKQHSENGGVCIFSTHQPPQHLIYETLDLSNVD